MRTKLSKTKKKVFDAAITVFNTKGYHGSTVREIAQKANVNQALISYYFNGKKGLLENLLISFLEQYVSIIEATVESTKGRSAKKVLKEIVKKVITFQSENHQLTRLVYRELTLDSTLVREIMSTYLMKERYYLQAVLEMGMKQFEFRKMPVVIIILQLKGMLMLPYLQTQYTEEVLHLLPSEPYFMNQYYQEIAKWIEEDLSLKTDRSMQVTTS